MNDTDATATQRLGFIGAGQMGRALARGWISAHLVDAADVCVADSKPAATDAFRNFVPNCQIMDDNGSLVEACQSIVLAIKPQNADEVLEEIQPYVTRDKRFVSIMAGVPLVRLISQLGTERLVRVMPNTPSLIGKGASAFCRGPQFTLADTEWVTSLLAAVGLVVEVAETQMDAVTGLSGSGPAYVFQMIEALSDGGVQVGLPREIAMQLAAQTVLGAAAMVLESGDHPAVLKDRVASPGGTTIAGLKALEQGGLRSALIAAVEAATRRSRELSGPSS